MYNVKQTTIKTWFNKNKTKYVVTLNDEEIGRFNSSDLAFYYVMDHKRLNHVFLSDAEQTALSRAHDLSLTELEGKYCMGCHDKRSKRIRDHELELARAGIKRLSHYDMIRSYY